MSSSSVPAPPGGAPRSRPPRQAPRCGWSASDRSSTRTPCSRRAVSTPRSGRATRRTPGNSTSPTRCERATGSATRGWSRSSPANRRARSSSWPTGAASSRGPRAASSTSASSAPIAGGGPATRATSRVEPSSGRWLGGAPSSGSASRTTSTCRGCWSPMASASEPSPSTSTPAIGRYTWPMP